MVDELEPERTRVEHLQRGDVFLAPERDDVVARLEAAERVPFRRRIGILGRRTSEHGDDERVGMRAQHVRGPERGVVEVWREQQHSFERSLPERCPT